MSTAPKAVFIEVTDNATKLKKICEIVQKNYTQENMLILVPSPEAATYIDQLLWRFHDESFIPHTVAHSATRERVIITTKNENLNQAKILLNLCPHPIPIVNQFSIIYELMDKTDPSKEAASHARVEDYRKKGIPFSITNNFI